MKNAVEKAKKAREMIDTRYNLRLETITELRNAYKDDVFNLIACSFSLGYLQGAKATKAEMKRF